MYEELIQRLRETSMDFGEADHVSVMLLEAANAIEDLFTELRMEKVDNINLTGQLVEEHAKHLWIPVTDEEHISNTDHGVVGYFGGGAFNQLRWYDFITTLSDGTIVGESTERNVINEHCIAVYKLPEPPKEET